MEPEYKVEYYEPNAKIFGKTYGQWTTEWWRWLLSTPTEVNPLVDETGQHSSVNQPSSNVWFLAGSFPQLQRKFPTRKCHMPRGRSLLFPIINCEANRLEYPKLKYDSELIEHVENDMNTIVRKDCLIEGNRVIPVRVASDPKIFQLTIIRDNPIGVKDGGSTSATADGYWVFLKPLRNGHYILNFQGSCELGRLNSGATYGLDVF